MKVFWQCHSCLRYFTFKDAKTHKEKCPHCGGALIPNPNNN